MGTADNLESTIAAINQLITLAERVTEIPYFHKATYDTQAQEIVKQARLTLVSVGRDPYLIRESCERGTLSRLMLSEAVDLGRNAGLVEFF